MSTIENEETVETTEEEEFSLAPAADLDDLFSNESEDDFVGEVEIPDDLSEDELRARLTAAEKRAAFAEQQRVTTARKSWATEAEEHFPYSDPSSIKATSRRAFMEEAKSQDVAFRKRAEPILAKVSKKEEDLKAEIREELEKEAAAAFGRPHTQSGGSATGEASQETDKKIDRARSKRDYHGAVAAMMDGGRF